VEYARCDCEVINKEGMPQKVVIFFLDNIVFCFKVVVKEGTVLVFVVEWSGSTYELST
jgi:hypothetical protein